MGVEDDAECRRKLDEQRKKMQRELQEVGRLSFASKELQENLVESLQHQLQELEKRRNDLMPEHQRVNKRSQKIQSIQDKRKTCRKRAWRQEKKCGTSKKILIGKKSDSVSCRTMSIKTGWQMRRWRQSFRDCKLEKKVEVAMHRRQVMAAWRPCGSNLSPREQMELKPLYKGSKGRNVKMNKSKAEPVSSWCHSRQAGQSSCTSEQFGA